MKKGGKKKSISMDLAPLIEQIKKHPDYHKVGMILCHNGVVRGTSRDGRKVSGLRVSLNHDRLAQILSVQKSKPGIVDIQAQIAEGRNLPVGEDVMLLVVAGDIRENVIAVLRETLDAIKTTVTEKTEFFPA